MQVNELQGQLQEGLRPLNSKGTGGRVWRHTQLPRTFAFLIISLFKIKQVSEWTVRHGYIIMPQLFIYFRCVPVWCDWGMWRVHA